MGVGARNTVRKEPTIFNVVGHAWSIAHPPIVVTLGLTVTFPQCAWVPKKKPIIAIRPEWRVDLWPCPLLLIVGWEAGDHLGTRLIVAAPTEREKTICIDGLPAMAKFNQETTLGHIEAQRSVLEEMEPRFVSALVHTTLMLNPTLQAVLIHLNSVDITSLPTGILPHAPKSKDKAKGKDPTGRDRKDVVYWIAEDADDCVFASTKPSRLNIMAVEVPK